MSISHFIVKLIQQKVIFFSYLRNETRLVPGSSPSTYHPPTSDNLKPDFAVRSSHYAARATAFRLISDIDGIEVALWSGRSYRVGGTLLCREPSAVRYHSSPLLWGRPDTGPALPALQPR